MSTGEVSLAVVLSSTKVSEVPGITLASLRSEITIGGESLSPMDLPTIEAEVALAGKPLTLNILPISPVGAPSPAVIVGALCKTYGINLRLIAAGLKKKPKVQYMSLDTAPGGDIRRCEGVKNAEEVFKKASSLAEAFSRYDCVIIGESIPGGTTTAAAFLEALGYRAVDKVSSTLPEIPRCTRRLIIDEALKCLAKHDLADVFKILEAVGDPVIPVVAGLASGLVRCGVKVILGGGTQMAAVLALLKEVGTEVSELFVVTTKWVAEDPSAGFAELISNIAPSTMTAYLSIDFLKSKYEGLRLYEQGYVKEGFGLGAVLLATYLRSKLQPEDFIKVIDDLYAQVLTLWGT